MEMQMLFERNIQLLFFQDHIAFWTNKVDADFHQHHYIQLTLAIGSTFFVEVDGREFTTSGVLIDSKKQHRLQGTNGWQLYLLVSPESVFGESLKNKIKTNKGFMLLDSDEIQSPEYILDITSWKDREHYDLLLSNLKKTLGIAVVDTDSRLDSRIQQALDFISDHTIEEINLRQISKYVHLSESRLSHLFKEEMGISLTGYLLHEKLKRAFLLIFGGKSLTESALEAGFNSSSHFTRSAREKLGMTPSAIKK
ncbi:helix-turn-helix domain-containing protein [Lysinibacillus odysseyi]|nr:helix-turn-helix domain-containing protein [Lysinibacillus odysseyi]